MVTFESVPVQENLGDKLRPISLAITHTIKPVPPRRHSGSKRLEKLAPILNVSPSNTLHSEVSGRMRWIVLFVSSWKYHKEFIYL